MVKPVQLLLQVKLRRLPQHMASLPPYLRPVFSSWVLTRLVVVGKTGMAALVLQVKV